MLKLLISTFTLSLAATQAQEPEEYFEDDELIGYNIIIQTETIELKSGVLEKLILKEQDTGNKLRNAVQKLVKAKKAKVVDSTMSVSSAGTSSRTISALQYIYPTEYTPSGWGYVYPTPNKYFPFSPNKKIENRYIYTNLRNGKMPSTAFEERPVGTTVETTATLDHQGSSVSLDFDVDQVSLSHLALFKDHKDQWGEAKFQLPQFKKTTTRTGLTLSHNSYQFVSQSNALNKDGTMDRSRTIATFVRSIIRPITNE